MTVAFDHTIVHVKDRAAAARSLADVLGVAPPTALGPFAAVRFANGAVLFFADTITEPLPMHYAFLVGECDFDAVRGRLEHGTIAYWADPFEQLEGRISTDDGRALYWKDADGNKLEIRTVPDGGWPDG